MKLLEHSGFLVRERAHHFSRYDAAAFVRGDLKHQYVPRFEVRVFGGQVFLLLFGDVLNDRPFELHIIRNISLIIY